jgi:putative DNA modification/repair radical SAM protein
MDVSTKLGILADAAKYDASCASSGTTRRNSLKGGLGSTTGSGICHSYTPDGRCVSLLKILLTNFCIYDCLYCINRSSSSVPRARFTVEEVINLTLDFYRRNYIEGLFLSSGIIRNPDYTMEQVTTVARKLRLEHGFRGYIHLKTIPEAAAELIQEAGRWADRISINVELPSQPDLEQLAPEKNLVRIEKGMRQIRGEIDAAKSDKSKHRAAFAPAGQSTQMIVGATPSSDATILRRASHLYRTYRLRRVYYSAFSPIPDSSAKLPLIRPPLVREHRLYQADWLLRFYGFGVEEIANERQPQLSLDMDPKLAWALQNQAIFPVNLNTAPREILLRVPGLGVRNVNRILGVRRWHKLMVADLRRLRVPLQKVLLFVELVDHAPRKIGVELPNRKIKHEQLSFFSESRLTVEPTSVLTGEL